ncbi:hypothetical protein E1202_09530 [Saccharopolyspora karakumensis]|uniref:Uncharacterized protein n=1 Tax=Saccharopolyspora karakumensis TaxID=2530386 RepID=A0A4R5BSI1_9PSEU|nr:hypothetical protein [Saccharopolyspora karakumensis]TDD89991.1 hypothetical protein E1202_09530 [Saccharopolyspora karakumensis]
MLVADRAQAPHRSPALSVGIGYLVSVCNGGVDAAVLRFDVAMTCAQVVAVALEAFAPTTSRTYQITFRAALCSAHAAR